MLISMTLLNEWTRFCLLGGGVEVDSIWSLTLVLVLSCVSIYIYISLDLMQCAN